MSSVVLAVLLAGQSAPAAQSATPSLQQLFDQATQAATEGDCAKAIPLFEQIESNSRAMSGPLTRAAVDVRKGSCLIEMERGEGEMRVRRGLPVLAARGAGFADEVQQAHLALGRLAAQRFDYSTAADEYKLALEGMSGKARLRPLIYLARALAFDQDGEGLRYATEARTIALADTSLSKRDVAAVQTEYARTLMNAGRPKEAYAELKDSLRKQGGLDLKVNSSDILTRSDLAIAASLNKEPDEARKYLAYTGAGRFKDSPLSRATSMQAPLCGGSTGLKPEHSAIVQFSLAEDGHVVGVQPIYTTGGRNVAVAFSRAVADWSWQPEVASSIPPFFRGATRVEIRCTTAGERPSLMQPLTDSFAEWAEGVSKGDAAWKSLPDAKAAPLQRAAVERARAANDQPALLLALVALGENPVLPREEQVKALEEAMTLAGTLKLPAPARAMIVIDHLETTVDYGRARRDAMRTLLARPDISSDPLSVATVRMMVATPLYRGSRPDDAPALLEAVSSAPDLPEHHPLKVAALLEQANMLGAKGKLEEARKLFDQTGLTTEQCALLGVQPVRRNAVSSNAYPADALRMGFEGWVKMEFDIAANGTTIRPRVLAAYPPFVFNEAGEAITRGGKYSKSFRPEEAVACTARQESFTFRIPD